MSPDVLKTSIFTGFKVTMKVAPGGDATPAEETSIDYSESCSHA